MQRGPPGAGSESGNAMTSSPPAEIPILVVEEDEGLRQTFTEVLAEDDYAPTFVSSLAEASHHLDTRSYALVLTHLFIGHSHHHRAEAHRLLCYASPTPVGLLTTQTISADDTRHAGFAFSMSLPFDIDDFLGHIAAAIDQPLSHIQRQQAEIVQRYFAALEAGDGATLLSLCSEDVTLYPPRNSVLTTRRRFRGKSDLLAYAQSAAQVYIHAAFTDLRLYPCPKGIAARYTHTWASPDGHRHQAAQTANFHFDGSRIRQVGVRVNLTAAVAAGSAS